MLEIRRSFSTAARCLNSFDKLFPLAKEKKAWDGQDKDKFFRDRYSHINRKRTTKRKSTWPADIKEELRPVPRKIPHRVTLVDPLHENVFGTNAVLSALKGTRTHSKLTTAYFKESINRLVLEAAEAAGIPIEYGASKRMLNQLCDNGVHNGYVLTTRKLVCPSVTELQQNALISEGVELALNPADRNPADRNPLGLYLDEITDTHNMGALIRSAQFLGFSFVAFSQKNCAPLSPVVAKASSGAIDAIRIYNVPEPLSFADSSVANGWQFVAALPTLRGIKANKIVGFSRLHELAAKAPTVLVLGSEGEGLRTSLVQRSSHAVTIKRSNTATSTVDSLNVSVAGALLMAGLKGAQALD